MSTRVAVVLKCSAQLLGNEAAVIHFGFILQKLNPPKNGAQQSNDNMVSLWGEIHIGIM